ncbi:hypothetical protein TorRG33x02_263160 [Trema orientale]|uniref:Uncharacterized protein n=1 Tax=Trema orientale TaxID=63057 RepID=A0A2P5D3X7_TREOI|nr:hypothetical protein TorRG33x02_263160 [Trema orientale]
MSSALNNFKESRRQIIEMLKKANLDRRKQLDIQRIRLDIQRRSLVFEERKEENKILFLDLNSISNPNVRDFFRVEQARIIRKRAQQQQQQEPSSATNVFGQYFDNIRGSETAPPKD